MSSSDKCTVLPPLVASIVVHPVSRKFSLVMDEYLGPEAYLPKEVEPAQKRRRLSLCRKKKIEEEENEASPHARNSDFGSSFVSASDTKYKELAKGFVPKNTSKATAWAIRNFETWRFEGNKVLRVQEWCPDDLLTKTAYSNSQLCHWLSRFIVETSKQKAKSTPRRLFINCCVE